MARSHRSHGFVVGHVVPEAQVGGPIALVQDGDVITIDAVNNTLEMDVSDEELARRRTDWVAPPLKVSSGTLYKYTKVRPSLPLTLEASLRAHLM
jgi:dihydroxy-acid dehydratase